MNIQSTTHIKLKRRIATSLTAALFMGTTGILVGTSPTAQAASSSVLAVVPMTSKGSSLPIHTKERSNELIRLNWHNLF
ncbi:hypothetical protein [Saccharibacillus qingshengii]|uniref:hypothetical protein n=1 Tax=Saccharibacillus qingshengii TaxID=1763540 RepID=UPI0015580E61|nr:hypothetical protein [Saccharibacillus qingshengii]